ncbi:MAG: tetratricopeptide repeat protein, partial [Pyrinomonadaceae bacterium]|nr:tetratricopeptide repeat protein [Pyrinomonadaceae bacterium]
MNTFFNLVSSDAVKRSLPDTLSRFTICCLVLAVCLLSGATQIFAQGSAEQDLKQGNYAAAIKVFNTQIATNPKDQTAQAGLLQALYETGQYAEVEQSAKKFLIASSASQARLWLGEAYAATGRYREAIGEFERASQRSSETTVQTAQPIRLQADLRRAEVLHLVGQEDQARVIFESLVRYFTTANPQIAPEITVIARALNHLERYKEAADLYLQAIAADASYIEAQLGGGELFTTKYNYAEAAEFFSDVLKINPNNARAHLGIAINKQIEGSEGVQGSLAQALAINPNLVAAKTLRAMGDMEAERYDSAAGELDQTLHINPNSLEAHAVRAALLYLQDRTADYEAEIKQTLAINPRYGKLFDTLSHVATNTRRYSQAVEFARRAISISPRLWEAHLKLGIGLMRLGRDAEGRAAIETAFKGDPFNVWAKNTLDLLDTMRDYRETQTGSFRIKAAAKESDTLGVYAADLLTEAERALTTKYRFKPQPPITVELFPNHEDFAVRTLGLPGLGALGVCFGQVIALDSPSARPVGQFNWGSTLWHEYTHVMTLQMTEYRIPRWFSEGLSVYEERRGRPGWGDDWSLTNLKAFADGRWFKIADLDGGFMRPRTPED